MREHRREIAASTLRAYNCTAAERDVILFRMLRKAPGPRSAGPAYCVGGIRLCKRVAQSALMTGSSRQARIRKARCDARRLGYVRESPRFGEVYSFLWHVYAHVAEARADEPLAVGDDGVAKEVRAFSRYIRRVRDALRPGFQRGSHGVGEAPSEGAAARLPKGLLQFLRRRGAVLAERCRRPAPSALQHFQEGVEGALQEHLDFPRL